MAAPDEITKVTAFYYEPADVSEGSKMEGAADNFELLNDAAKDTEA